jgi:O-antigen/teichoic acid export membrane protein
MAILKILHLKKIVIQISQQRRDLLFTLLNQLWRLISGPLTMLLIPLFLSPEQQGYWFLFGSLSALSIFADLGFSTIILQFSAHEFAYLHFLDNGLLAGDDDYLRRLGSFFRFVLKWISTICVIVFPIIYIIGIGFFIRDDVLNIYLIPWTLYSIGSLINFFNHSILSYIEGLDKIEIVQKIRFRVTILNTCIIMMILVSNGNIYALSLGMLLSASSIFISIFGIFKKLLTQLWNISKGFIYDWRKEILPLFLRYAISWSSGYFIFQIYTPLTHYFHGPVYSGKVGITLALISAILNMSNVWMYTITPKMNMLISQKSWTSLDGLFRKRLSLSLGTYLLMVIGLFCFVVIFGKFWIIPKIIIRFLPITSIVILMICNYLQLIINSWALYLRGHKQEPYVIPSVVSAIWIAITTYLAGRFLPPALIFSGFLTSYIWCMPIYRIIFIKCKKKWHDKRGYDRN